MRNVITDDGAQYAARVYTNIIIYVLAWYIPIYIYMYVCIYGTPKHAPAGIEFRRRSCVRRPQKKGFILLRSLLYYTFKLFVFQRTVIGKIGGKKKSKTHIIHALVSVREIYQSMYYYI